MPERLRPRLASLTLNPAVDLSFTVDGLVPGRKLRVRDARRDPGGGGVNVARAIRRLGGRCPALFLAGGPAGDRLQALLRSEKVPQLAIPAQGETREDITAEDAAGGREYRFVLPGPQARPAELAAAFAAVEALSPRPQVLVASGSLPLGAPVSAYARLARLTRRLGVKLALDTSGEPLRRALAAGLWLVKPNLAELQDLTGADLPDLASRLRACRAIVAVGGAELVALSMGAAGALLVSKDEAWVAAGPTIAPVSTVGAGDSFMAALVLSLAGDGRLAPALQLATAAGAAALLARGTQLCHLADVRALAPQVRIQQVGVSATPPRPAAA